jgi:hypothetical protein
MMRVQAQLTQLALGGIKWQKCFYALASNSGSVLIIPAQQILKAENGRFFGQSSSFT